MTLSINFLFRTAVLIMITIGCNQFNQIESEQQVEMITLFVKKTDIISLTGDYQFRHTTNYQQYYSDTINHKSYLVRGDWRRNSIEFFSLNSQRLEHFIQLTESGPHGIGRLGGFYIASLDSIYLFGLYKKTIYLTDRDGRIINKYRIDEHSNTIFGDFLVYTVAPLIRTKFNELAVALFPSIDFTTLPEVFYKSSIHACVNIDSNYVRNSTIRYPTAYLNSNYAFGIEMNMVSRTYNELNSYYVFSFPIDPHIYVEDLEGNISKYYAPSRYFEYSPPAKSKNHDWENERFYYIQTPKYLSIVYDQYRNIYYRFCQLPIEYKKGMYLPPNVSEIMPFSIMVLDEDFNILGEQLFEANTYLYTDFFVNEEGLWISTSNPENPNFDENKLSFVLLTIDDEILAKTY